MATLSLPLLSPPSAPAPALITDPERLAPLAQDAAALTGTGAAGLVEPRNEAELCAWLRANPTTPILVQGALTSLTGGATPSGEVVISTARLDSLLVDAAGQHAVVGPGLILGNLQEQLAERGLYYPPAPTHDGASIGGNVATNAAGAATFKYGTTRDWVEHIRLVLRHGEVLEIRRGENTLQPGDTLELAGERLIQIPIPNYTSPDLKKTSAGYFVKRELDPIDLFIGSEGTLGILSKITLRLVPRPTTLMGLVFLPSASQAVQLTDELRRRSMATRAGEHPGGLDIRSIEFFDQRCLQLLEEEEQLDDLQVVVPPLARACLLFEQELPAGMDDEETLALLEAAFDGTSQALDPLADLVQALGIFHVLDDTELALPAQQKRKAQLAAVREAIPLSLSERLRRHQARDPAIHKLGGDMIVPFQYFERMLKTYYKAFGDRGVDLCVFGHISDGNVHPNGLPVGADDMLAGDLALMDLAQVARKLGGCPLSEHGVGKHPLKRRMLSGFWGPGPMAAMQAVKAALDPGWTLARGVLFDPPTQ